MTRTSGSRIAWLIYLVVALAAFLCAVRPLADYDIWFHIKTGEWILQHHEIPRQDVFSYSAAGQPWVAHEWAFGVLLALIHGHLGLLGLIYFKALLAAATFVLLAWLCIRCGASPLLTAVIVAGGAVCTVPWLNARPQMVLPLFVIIVLHLLRSYQEGRRQQVLWLPLVFFLWVNLHGGFLIGFVILAIFAFSQLFDGAGFNLRRSLPRPRIKPHGLLAAAILLSILVTLLNPYGLTGALYPFQYICGSCQWHQEAITEYLSPNFHEGYIVNIEVFMLLALLALVISPVAPTLFELLALFVLVHMFLKWGRNAPLMVVIGAPIMGRHLTERIKLHFPGLLALDEDSRLVRPVVRWAAAAVLIGLLVWLAPKNPAREACVNTYSFPLRAAQVVQENHIQGNMYNTYRWGGYLIYALWPDYKVFMDGRADMYGETLFREYQATSQLKEGWQDTLRKYDIQWLLVEEKSPLVQALALRPEYALIFSDGDSRLFIRKEGVNRPVYEAFRAGRLRRPPPFGEPATREVSQPNQDRAG